MLASAVVKGQGKDFIVTRTVEKSFSWVAGDVLNIDAEKAEVNVTGWNEPYFQITLQLSARNSSKSVAEKDLDLIKYSIQKNKSQISLKNALALPSNQKALTSLCKVVYTIKAPNGTAVNLKNFLGDCNIANLNTQAILNTEFGNITLRNVQGKWEVNSKFSDLNAYAFNGALVCKANKADVAIEAFGGDLDVETFYGTVNLKLQSKMRHVQVYGYRTEVMMETADFDLYNYQVSTLFSDIIVPAAYDRFIKAAAGKTVFRYAKTEGQPWLVLTTPYSKGKLTTGIIARR